MSALIAPAAAREVVSLDRPIRVMSVSHSATRAGAARIRYEALATDPTLDLTLVVPKVWHEFGQSRAEHAEPSSTPLKVEISPARLTRAGPAKWYLYHYPRMRQLIQKLKPDVIHLWEEPWSVAALHATRLRDKVSPHSALVLETDQNIFRRLPAGFEHIRRYTLARCDMLIARSQEALAVSQQAGYRGLHEFVEYGTNTACFYPRDTRPGAGGDRQAFRIGYVGRLVPEKGLMDVLDAMHRSTHPVVFELLGEGPERDRLIARAAELGMADRVRLLPSCEPEGVAEFMGSLDALVLMSRTTRTWKEQFGRVIMESLACGVPVIGSSSGSIPRVVGNGGWIVPEGDSDALADLLDRLAGAPAEVTRAGAIGLQEVRSRFSYDALSADLRRAWLRAAKTRSCGTA